MILSEKTSQAIFYITKSSFNGFLTISTDFISIFLKDSLWQLKTVPLKP